MLTKPFLLYILRLDVNKKVQNIILRGKSGHTHLGSKQQVQMIDVDETLLLSASFVIHSITGCVVTSVNVKTFGICGSNRTIAYNMC